MTGKKIGLDLTTNIAKLNIALKILLFLMFFIATFFPIDHLEGKAIAARAPFFLGAVLVLPILSKVKKWKTYPHLADVFISIPFLLDTGGNLLYLFDSVWFYDDLIHALNWTCLVLAFHALRFRTITDARDAILLGIGVGAIMIVAWELVEWFVSVDGIGAAGALSLTYGDTIGDLFTSTFGGIVGSVIGVKWLGGRFADSKTNKN